MASVDGAGWAKLDEVPFDFERRRVSVLVEKDGRRILVVKGAPEDVLRLSSHYEEPGESDAPAISTRRPMREPKRFSRRLGSEGFRALGVAWRDVGPDHPHAVVGDEQDLVFAGFVAFLDPPKQGVGAAIEAPRAQRHRRQDPDRRQ